MKRKFITRITFLMAGIALGVGISHAIPKAEPTSEMNYYAYADSLDIIEIIDCADLTLEELENRNGKLIIERVIGVVDDATTGAGHAIDNADDYISYSVVKDISKGNVICTYFVYNPDTNYCDDIISRFDYIIDN